MSESRAKEYVSINKNIKLFYVRLVDILKVYNSVYAVYTVKLSNLNI